MKRRASKLKAVFLCCLTLIMLVSCITVLMINIDVYATGQGVAKASVQGNMYNPPLDSGYDLTNKVDKTVFGSSAYTALTVQTSNGSIQAGKYNGFNAFGVIGDSVSLRLKINHAGKVDQCINNSSEWMLCSDLWGKEDGETVNGVVTGEVKSGAVIVQTSSDGKNWSNENEAKYVSGLYTTDYNKNYGTHEQTIYVPNGNEIIQGIYIRVLYAYEVYDYISCTHENSWWDIMWGAPEFQHDDDNEYQNYIEEYTFYLCSNSLQGVTFHNLSLNQTIEEEVVVEDSTMLEIIQKSETLTDGSVTVTGFSIDKSLNQTATVTIKKNYQNFTIPSNNEIREEGRYDITVKTPIGTESSLTIYVVPNNKEKLYSLYFGDSFLSGKRLYSKDDIPLYEGGLTLYNIQSVTDINPFIWGEIINQTTGKVTTIDPKSSYQSQIILEPGVYLARFNTNSTYRTDSPSGDNHTFVFKFKIIEKGTAPGPQVNKESLQSFAKASNPSNVHSTYYGVTFQSANKGNITLAFSSYEAAREFAYDYEKGIVEVQPDGSFRYTGTLVVAQKIKYESAWDLTDAINYFADQAVQKLRFDLRDEFTYLTISEDVLESVPNLRTLELTKSVVVFADDTEKEKLLKSSAMPVINSQKYSYLVPGSSGEVVSGYNDFKFVGDAHGYDSTGAVIINKNGDRFTVEYDKSVSEQLKQWNFETGIITIEESNKYGDISVYEAFYFAENDNTARIDLKIIDENGEHTKDLDIEDNNSRLIANAFYVQKVVDSYDPFGTVIISKDGKDDFYCYDEWLGGKKYTECGTYTVTLVNRLGYAYSFVIEIEESVYYTIELYGNGIDKERQIMYSDGDIVNLPTLTRYGFDFVGYVAPDGTVYSGVVHASALKEHSRLKTVWSPKNFNLTLNDAGKIYGILSVVFGETYTLPILDSTEEKTFLGWVNSEGEFVTTIVVDEEGDLLLTARFEEIVEHPEDNTGSDGDAESDDDQVSGETETDNDENQNTDNSEDDFTAKPREWWVWLILIVLAIIGLILSFLYGLGLPLLVLSILCMIWPETFWWFIWWYY